MTTSFTDMFPELIDESRRLYGTFSIIASVLVFAGLTISAVNGSFGDLNRAIRGLVMAALVVAMIGIFPRLTDMLQDMGHSLVVQIGADPSESHQKFAHLIAGPEAGDEIGFWDILWNSENGGIGKAILYAFVLVLGKISLAITWQWWPRTKLPMWLFPKYWPISPPCSWHALAARQPLPLAPAPQVPGMTHNRPGMVYLLKC